MLPKLKKAKRAILSGLEDLGIAASIRDSAWRKQRLVILCYHGVSIDDEHEWDSALFVSQDFLARRMEQIARGGYNVLPLSEAVSALYESSLPPRAVAITFDDGNHDFLTRALPVLQSHGFPATVYLTTYYSEHNLPVFDVAVRYIVWKGRSNLAGLKKFLSMRGFPSSVNANSEALSWEVVRYAKSENWSTEQKEDLLQKMAHVLDVDYERILEKKLLHIMTPEEVRAIAEADISVELHTHRHRTPLDRSSFLQELRENSLRIERTTGSMPLHFCYPNGFFQSEFLPWLREAGVRSATTTQTGLASQKSERLLLPRIIDHSGLSPAEFEGWLSGAALALPHRRLQPKTQ